MNDTVVARNRKARHDYEILETFEAGLVLRGTEVKSVRAGKLDLRDGYASIDGGEAWLHNVRIQPYDPASQWNVDPVRTRKLLLHKSQVRSLYGKVEQTGLTLVPLDVHFSSGYAKVTLAIARGKKKYDKRESIRRREMKREAERELGRRR